MGKEAHQNVRTNPLFFLVPDWPYSQDLLLTECEKQSPPPSKVALEAAVLGNSNYALPAFLDVQTVFAIGPRVGDFKPIKGASTFLGTVHATITDAK